MTKLTAKEKAQKDRKLARMLERAREIQKAQRLPLRELVTRLRTEGFAEANLFVVSQEGLAAQNFGPVTPAEPPEPPIDTAASPIAVTRALAEQLARKLAKTPEGSVAYTKLTEQLRAVAKQIASLESENAGKESPEEADRRRRREDGETVKMVNQYVDQALMEALRPTHDAPHGRCVTCGVALTLEQRQELIG